jgi:Protein of unknown function (DUF2637)
MNFSELPPSLRRILAIALLLVTAIGAGAFTLSFVALREVAAQPDAGWGPLAFLFPLIIDGLLVAAEVVLVAASMLHRERLLPLAFVIGAGAVTIWFNITRVPAPVRPVTAIPPIASIAATILIAYLVKILAVALGRPLTYLPPPAQTGVLAPTQAQAPLAGQLTRLPDATTGLPEVVPYQYTPGVAGYGPGPYGPPVAFGQTPTWAPSQIQQTGQPVVGGNPNGELAEATKRRQVEAYLATLTPDQLGRLAGLGPKAAARELTPTLNGQGLQVSERYVQQILDEFLAARRGSGAAARRPRKR